MDTYWSLLRAANVPLLLFATLVLFVRFNDGWRRSSLGWKLIRVGALVLFLGIAIGSMVRYVLHSPVDWLVILPAAASLLVILGGWLSRHEEPPHRP